MQPYVQPVSSSRSGIGSFVQPISRCQFYESNFVQLAVQPALLSTSTGRSHAALDARIVAGTPRAVQPRAGYPIPAAALSKHWLRRRLHHQQSWLEARARATMQLVERPQTYAEILDDTRIHNRKDTSTRAAAEEPMHGRKAQNIHADHSYEKKYQFEISQV